jgi:hypothetical protein
MVFAKITAPLAERWRAKGRHVLPSLDDFLGGSPSEDGARLFAHEMLSDMKGPVG